MFVKIGSIIICLHLYDYAYCCSVTNDFLSQMKNFKVTKVTDVQVKLEKLQHQLKNINISLGEYLEKARASFPR